MIVIPILELRRGTCVRPSATDGSDTGTSLGSAVSVARGWAQLGFHRIHVVDSEAVAGTGSNAGLVEDVIRDGAIDVETNDAPQSTDQIERLVDAGAVRVVVGPRGLDEPDWLAEVATLFPGLLIVGTDVRERRVVTRGWVRTLPHDILDLVDELNGIPLGGLLVTSSITDSPRGAVDLSLLEDVAEECAFPVIASGGVATMSDLRALEHRGVAAVLLGDALYGGQLDPHRVAMEFDE